MTSEEVLCCVLAGFDQICPEIDQTIEVFVELGLISDTLWGWTRQHLCLFARIWSDVRQSSPRLGQIWTIVVKCGVIEAILWPEFGPTSANVGPGLAKVGRFRPNLARVDRVLASCVQCFGIRENSARVRPKLDRVRPSLGDFGRSRHEFSQTSASPRPNSTEPGPNLADIRQLRRTSHVFVRTQANFGSLAMS